MTMSKKNLIEIDSEKYKLVAKKLRFLEKSNSALVSMQDKIEKLSHYHAEMFLSHDSSYILKTGLALLQELVKTEGCSIFLVDDDGFEFVHKMSIPESFSTIAKKEVDAQIISDNFGWAVNNGTPVCVAAEVLGKADKRSLSVMLAPIAGKERTIGLTVVAFDENPDFIRQQTLTILNLFSGFFSLSLENAYLFEDLRQTYFETIRAITNSIEARDLYTRGHSDRVAEIAKTIAEKLNWEKKEVDLIDWGGMLHDVGKIGISDAILNKPDRLTQEEYKAIKNHPLIGKQIVQEISFLDPVIPYICEHHERFDGKGYPKGLSGEDISIKGRLLAVADTFDAITSDRPYRMGFEPEVAFTKILNNAGTQFDPKIVKAFEKAWLAGAVCLRANNRFHDCCM